jgi:hypothetical protein
MKYIGKYFSMEILKLLLTCVCTNDAVLLSKVVLGGGGGGGGGILIYPLSIRPDIDTCLSG